MRGLIASIITIGILMASCSKVPITNRKQVNLLPESQMMAMSLDAYNEVLGTSNVINSGAQYEMVKNTGSRISAAVESYLRNNGKQAKRIKDFKWEFNLIKNDTTANAWCMPGGKVAFYTGIMPITATEAGTAVVMGHEIAHAIARHGNERTSQGLALQLGGIGLSTALGTKAQQTQDIFNQAYGVVGNLGILKFSRKHESEADKMGLMFMAMAGYDPNEAVDFWQRMASNSGGGQPPEFISTHPSHDTRISDLQENMPTAMVYYNGNASRGSASKGNSGTSPKTGGVKPPKTGGVKPTKTDTNTNPDTKKKKNSVKPIKKGGR